MHHHRVDVRLHRGTIPPPAVASHSTLIDNLLVRIHFIIVMIRWTGLAPWEFKFRCVRRSALSRISGAGPGRGWEARCLSRWSSAARFPHHAPHTLHGITHICIYIYIYIYMYVCMHKNKNLIPCAGRAVPGQLRVLPAAGQGLLRAQRTRGQTRKPEQFEIRTRNPNTKPETRARNSKPEHETRNPNPSPKTDTRTRNFNLQPQPPAPEPQAPK